MCELSLKQDMLNPIIIPLGFLEKPNDSCWKFMNKRMLEGVKTKQVIQERQGAPFTIEFG